MKHVLYSCDCCGKTHPTAAPKGWWGINNPTAAVPVFSFQPLTKYDKTEYPRHMCSLDCLQKTLQVMSESVDIKAVRAAKPDPDSQLGYSFFNRIFLGGIAPGTDTHDSTGTYKKKKEDAEDDDADTE